MADITMDGVELMHGKDVIGHNEGWDSHTMRLFRILSGGHSPHHQHDWEHINYVTKGRGQLQIGEKINELAVGDFALVPSNIKHQFSNPNDEPFEFICIVPIRGAYPAKDDK